MRFTLVSTADFLHNAVFCETCPLRDGSVNRTDNDFSNTVLAFMSVCLCCNYPVDCLAMHNFTCFFPGIIVSTQLLFYLIMIVRDMFISQNRCSNCPNPIR